MKQRSEKSRMTIRSYVNENQTYIHGQGIRNWRTQFWISDKRIFERAIRKENTNVFPFRFGKETIQQVSEVMDRIQISRIVTNQQNAMCAQRRLRSAWASAQYDDQPVHPPSLIRAFAVRLKKARILSYPLSAQRRLWSDREDAQADLSLRLAHMQFRWFCQ